MFINAAYLHDHTPAVVDESKPVIVTSCGNYRLIRRSMLETKRPFGRKDYQLLYVSSGKAYFTINGETYTAASGSVVIYRPDEPQDYVYYAEDKPDVFWVHFTGGGVERFLPSAAAGVNNDHNNMNNMILQTGTSPELQRLFEQIIMELQLCRPKYEEIISLHLQNILLLISRYTENAKTGSPAGQEIISAIHYFREHYQTEISIEEYAASCNFSLSWFIRSFKKMTGKTPLQYILSQRIATAKSLLEHTDYSVSEIAENVGYENALYFSRIFRKQTGMSPSEYRKCFEEKDGFGGEYRE